jgi:ABC-type sugar transport system permease subunit
MPYLFVLPAFLFYFVFLALPIVGTVFISFFDWSGVSLNDLDFIGLSNYAELLTDDVFWKSLKHNLYFIAGGMTSVVILGLLLAVLLEQNLPGSSFFRGVFFIPTIMSLVVVGIIFSLLLSPEFGLVNPLLEQLGLGRFATAWLGNPATALPTIIVANTWQSFGLGMFLFVAGLKSIDAELYEAARIDGATPLQSFWRITMPLLWPVTTLVIILTSINTLKLFDLVYVMTSGGPNYASEVLTTFMYSQGFEFNRMGYGSALAVVILLITLLFTLVQVKVFNRGDDTRNSDAKDVAIAEGIAQEVEA